MALAALQLDLVVDPVDHSFPLGRQAGQVHFAHYVELLHLVLQFFVQVLLDGFHKNPLLILELKTQARLYRPLFPVREIYIEVFSDGSKENVLEHNFFLFLDVLVHAFRQVVDVVHEDLPEGLGLVGHLIR